VVEVEVIIVSVGFYWTYWWNGY